MRIVLIIIATALFSLQGMAQCRTFAKKSCEPQLDDYMVSGRMYGGYMSQGREVELVVILNGGQKYRLINCSKPDLGVIQLQLLDSKGNVVFDNADHDMAQNWDFDVKSTQEFKVRTIIPAASKRSSSSVRDCSILIIGSKSAS